MKKFFLILVNLSLVYVYGFSQVIDEFRGVGRTGVFNETNLMEKWPESGPKLLWSVENLPSGHSSFTSAYNTLYLTGSRDSLDVLIALDQLTGKVKWQTEYGRKWVDSYPLSRSTPTIDDKQLYVSSGFGDIACLNAVNGEIVWQVKAMEKFEGTFHYWGIAESLIVYDNKVFFMTGGNKTSMVALDKMTGETVWMSETLKDNPSYASPLLIQEGEYKLIVSITENYVVGIDPDNGEIYWKFSFGSFAAGQYLANNHCNMPVYDNYKLFITSGYDHKNVMLNLSDDLKKAYFLWSTDVLDTHHGGTVKIGDYVYGPNWEHNRMGRWVCMKWDTGETMYETEWINKGSIIAADGHLYCYEEKTGKMALVKATPEEFKVISSFQIPLGSQGPYWSHPVIKNGILFVRHSDAVMAFDIRE